MKRLNARISDDTHMAIKNGDAIFNNGLRSKKGYFWPEQPDFEFDNGIKEKILNKAIDFSFEEGMYFLKRTILPHAIDLYNTQIAPRISKKVELFFDRIEQRKKESKNNSNEHTTISKNEIEKTKQKEDNVINLFDFTKKTG